MPTIPTKVAERLVASIKRFQPVLQAAKARDVNESDTVIIVTDMLSDVFGYDKYSEVTSEYCIRGTFCDLATKIDGQIQALIEVKSIGADLKDTHTKQAVDYAANQGTEWVLLTNGAIWKVFRISFGKPVTQDLVVELDFLSLNPKSSADLDTLFLIAKEGWVRSAIDDYHTQKQVLNRYSISALLCSETVLTALRRELRRLSPEVKVETEQIQQVLEQQVIKRDTLEGEKADEARKKLVRATNRAAKAKAATVASSALVRTKDEPDASQQGEVDQAGS
jgi:hypothetical protein